MQQSAAAWRVPVQRKIAPIDIGFQSAEMNTTIRSSHCRLRAASVVTIFSLTNCATGVNLVSGRVERATMLEQDEIVTGRSNHVEVLVR